MYSVIYRVIDVSAWTTWLVSMGLTFLEGSHWILTIAMGTSSGFILVFTKLYIPYKKNKREQEAHELSMRHKGLDIKEAELDLIEQTLLNIRLQQEIDDYDNEITK